MKKSEYTKMLKDCDGDEDELKLVMAIQTVEEAGLSVSETDEPKTDTLKSVSELINRG